MKFALSKPKTTTPIYCNAAATSHPVTSASSSTFDDPFFLCWGSSVNVNEDLRRAVRSEVEEINASMEELSDKYGAAERVSAQLDRDLNHARNEMAALKADDLDVSKVNSQVRARLGETLQTSIANVLSPGKANDEEATDFMEIENGDNFESHLAIASEQVRPLKRSSAECLKGIRQSQAEIAAIEKEEKETSLRLAEGLNAALQSAATARKDALKEREKVLLEIRTKKEAVQHSRSWIGDYAQQIADGVTTLHKKRMKQAQEEADLSKMLEAKQRELDFDLEKQTEVTNELDLISGQLARLRQENAFANSIRMARDAKKKERETVATECDTLEAKNKELQEKADAAKSKLDVSTESLLRAEKKAARVKALKLANDEWESQHLASGRAELEQLLREKETLAGAVNSLHQTVVDAAGDHNSALAEQDKLLQTVQTEIEQTKEKLEATLSTKNAVLDEIAQGEQTTRDEIKELDDLVSTVKMAISAELVRKDDLTKQKQEEHQAKINEIQFEKDKAEQQVILQVLSYGKELVECTHESVANVNDAPLDETEAQLNDAPLDETKNPVDGEEEANE